MSPGPALNMCTSTRLTASLADITNRSPSSPPPPLQPEGTSQSPEPLQAVTANQSHLSEEKNLFDSLIPEPGTWMGQADPKKLPVGRTPERT